MRDRKFVDQARRMLCVFGLSISFLFGCGSSDSGGGGNSTGRIQMINGIIDTPNLSVEISDSDGDVIETISGLSFQNASALLSLSRGTYEVDVYYEDPDTGFEERLLSGEIDVRRNTIYIGLLNGVFADSQLTWHEKDEGDVTDTDDEIELQAINLSSDSMSVYLGDTSQALNAETLIATVAPGNVSDPVTFDYDDDADYHIRLTADGSTDLVYDSSVISIAESTRNLVLINDSIGPDPDSRSVSLVRDSNTTSHPNDLARAGFQVVNAVSDAVDVSVVVEVSATADELLDSLLLPDEVSPLIVVDPEFVDVEVLAPSDATSSNTTTVSMGADTAYSILVAGASLEDDVSIRANEMDLRRVANSINIHFVNGLRETDDEDVNDVDVYALPLGDSLSETTPSATGVGYLEGTSVIVGATPYDLVVTTAGTLSILAGPARIFPEGGERVIAIATEAAGGGRPFKIELAIDAD